MIAAFGAGWYSGITEAANSMTGSTVRFDPDKSKYARYRELLGIYRKLYAATAEINRDLVRFAES